MTTTEAPFEARELCTACGKPVLMMCQRSSGFCRQKCEEGFTAWASQVEAEAAAADAAGEDPDAPENQHPPICDECGNDEAAHGERQCIECLMRLGAEALVVDVQPARKNRRRIW